MRPSILPLACAIPLALLAHGSAALASEIDAGFDAHGFSPIGYDGQLQDPWGVMRPERFTPMSWYAGGLLEYAHAPLTHVTGDPDDPRTSPALGRVVALNMGVGLAPAALVRLEAGMPLYLHSTNEGESTGLGPGDLRLGASFSTPEIAILERLGLDLGLRPWLDLPTGEHTLFRGQRGVSGGFMGAAGYDHGPWSFAGHLGLQLNPAIELSNLVGTDALLAGLSAGRLQSDRAALHLETLLSLPLEASDERGTQLGAEAMLSYRRRVSDVLHLSVGAAGGLSRGAGVSPFRLIVGGGFGRNAPPPPPDRDLDGVADVDDPCPDQPETVNGYLDADGCPDLLGTVVAKPWFRGQLRDDVNLVLVGPDGEHHFGPGERLVAEGVMPGTQWAAEATAGSCLAGVGSVTAVEGPIDLLVDLERELEGHVTVRVSDAEGRPVERATVRFLAEKDPCGPYEPWLELDEEGKGSLIVGVGEHPMAFSAPYFAPQRETVSVAKDQRQQLTVVLEPARTKLEAGRIVIMDRVFFETGLAVIKRESHSLLEEVANVLLANPEVARLEVGGHTDDQGSDSSNLELSLARAQAVVDFLVAQGVVVERLVAEGYGESAPVADNATADGRAQNRRVEFNILERRAVVPPQTGGTP